MSEGEKLERAWLEDEVRLAARLTDADRVRIFTDLLSTAEAIQRTKSPEQLRREEEVRQLLEEQPGRERYFAVMDRLVRFQDSSRCFCPSSLHTRERD
jgi:hypothetical protein